MGRGAQGCSKLVARPALLWGCPGCNAVTVSCRLQTCGVSSICYRDTLHLEMDPVQKALSNQTRLCMSPDPTLSHAPNSATIYPLLTLSSFQSVGRTLPSTLGLVLGDFLACHLSVLYTRVYHGTLSNCRWPSLLSSLLMYSGLTISGIYNILAPYLT